jgi:hypothetical protein
MSNWLAEAILDISFFGLSNDESPRDWGSSELNQDANVDRGTVTQPAG